MISRLRARHRRMVVTLAVALPIVLVMGVMVRPETPEALPLPGALLALEVVAPEVLWERDDLWDGLPIVTRWRGAGGVPVAVELQLTAPLQRPEVLLYWSPTLGADAEALPETSHLLGALGGVGTRRHALPEAARSGEGHLLLYSLGHDNVFASAALPGSSAGGDR
jgi:hypothetical protein